MEIELIMELLTLNNLYTIAAVMFIIISVVWLMKQCVLIACKLSKAYREIEKSED